MQLHERDLALIEADLVFTRSYCHSSVIVPGEHADIDLAAVHWLVEPDLDLAAMNCSKSPGRFSSRSAPAEPTSKT